MKKLFKRDLRALDEVFTFITDFTTEHALDESVHFSISLAVEELFTNMIKYNAAATSSISINFDLTEDRLIATLVDAESKPFDLTKPRDAEIRRRLEKREPGGLGIHLTMQMVDELRYEHTDGKSIITLIKKLRR